jgi:phage shock protein A
MAESIFIRVRRVLSANVEEAVDSMERSGGAAVMREAIREVDRALDEVRSAQEAASARGLQAKRQQAMFRERIKELEAKAKFALGENRDDLAEAAISRQIDFEEQAKRLDDIQADAKTEAKRLEECVAELVNRKSQMEESFQAYEQAQRDAALGGEGPTQQDRDVQRKVRQAEDAFERAMGGAGVSATVRTDAKTAAAVAEIDVIHKSAVIAERMAAMRATG